MKILIAVSMVLTAVDASARALPQYPSCNLRAQRALQGDTDGSTTDPRQAHVSARADILQSDISAARRAQNLTQAVADRLHERVEAVKAGADGFTKEQGFLSAGEVASYDRELDEIAMQLCR